MEAENSELRRMRSNPLPNGHEAEPILQSAHAQRPSSMYEPREGLRASPWGNTKNQVNSETLFWAGPVLYIRCISDNRYVV